MPADRDWLERQLKPGETATALFTARDGTMWYATTGRVIKYKRDRFAEYAVEVPLAEIQEIQLQKRTNVRMMGFGSLFLFMGLIFLSLSLFGLFSLAILFLLIGGALFIYGYVKDTYLFQFQGDQLDEEEWQIQDTNKAARFFVQSIRQLKGLS